MQKFAPPPPVDLSTWGALVRLAVEFQELAPWEFMADTEVVGLEDPGGRDYRLANVLGNAGEVFGAVFYQGAGIGWLLKVMREDFDPEDLNAMEGMDCLKLEFVLKRELLKEDLAVLEATGFKPAKRGGRWPQFRSTTPGWHPWHISQREADQMLADLPRLIAFCRLLEGNPSYAKDRPEVEIPFLGAGLPLQPLTSGDLDWRPCVRLPEAPLSAFEISGTALEELLRKKPTPGLAFEFESAIMPGASYLEDGRPCFGRIMLLVESRNGIVVSVEIKPGGMSAGAAIGTWVVSALRKAPQLPSKVILRNSRWFPLLEGVLKRLGIEIRVTKRLPALEEALAHLEHFMMERGVR